MQPQLSVKAIMAMLEEVQQKNPTQFEQLKLMAIEGTKHLKWVPNPGPQLNAYESEADQLLYGGQAGGGKALALDTPLPTPTGWTTMGAVKIGDLLLGRDGRSQAVTAISPVMIGRDCFVVEFSDGSELIADGDHRWFTLTALDRDQIARARPAWREARKAKRAKAGKGKRPDLAARNAARAHDIRVPTGAVRTTREIAESLIARGRLNHSVPVCDPIYKPFGAEMPIDPYVLGAWLGDGSSYKAEITTTDAEILEAFHDAGYATVERAPITYGVYKLWTDLRAENLLANKHIPPQYLRGTIDQRLALLQGLMDTDGYADARGQCEFTSTNERLAFDTHELILSLGIKATVSVGRATLDGRDCGPKYRIKFVTGLPAFRLPRKLERQKRAGLRDTTLRRYIVDVRPIASVPVKCVAVDSEDHLYLAGRTFIPTHNTDILIGKATQRHKRSLILRRLNGEVQALIDRAEDIIGTSDGFDGRHQRWHLPDGRLIMFGGCQHPGDEKKYKGERKDFIGVDEASEFPESVINYVIQWLGTTDGAQQTQLCLATNPPDSPIGEWLINWFGPWVDPDHPLYPQPDGKLLWFKRIEKPGQRAEFQWSETPFEIELVNGRKTRALSRTFIRSQLSDNPDLDATDYAAQLESAPEELKARYQRGEFVTEAIDDEFQVIKTAHVIAAQERWKIRHRARPGPPEGWAMTAIGADIAVSIDRTVLSPRYNTWFAEQISIPGKQTDEGYKAALKIIEHLRDSAQINIDLGGGYGSSAYEYIKNNELASILGVVPGAGANGKSACGRFKFRNIRAEMLWRLREALEPTSGFLLELPPDPELREELTAAHWHITRSNDGAVIVIQEKDEIRQVLKRSPDKADALALAWYSGKHRQRALGFKAQNAGISRLQTRTNTDRKPNRYDRHAWKQDNQSGGSSGEQG